MEIHFKDAIKELEEYIDVNNKWVLSTSYQDYVTSRTMSVIHQGVNIYFQTNHCYIKAQQMKLNQNVSLCCGNVSIEGIVKDIGDWTKVENQHLKKIYKKKHLSSYQAYGKLSGQTVYMVIPHMVKIWKYVDGVPYRENIDFMNKTAKRIEFM